jgi:hypothetical protein
VSILESAIPDSQVPSDAVKVLLIATVPEIVGTELFLGVPIITALEFEE